MMPATRQSILAQIQEIRDSVVKRRPNALSAAKEFHKVRKRLLYDLEQIAAPYTTDARIRFEATFARFEIEMLAAPQTESSNDAKRRISQLSEELWNFDELPVDVDVRARALIAGLGASLDDSISVDRWVPRLQQFLNENPNIDVIQDICYNAACALASVRLYDAALEFAVRMPQANSGTSLVRANLLFAQKAWPAATTLLDMTHGAILRPDALDRRILDATELPKKLKHNQVLLLLSFGFHGIYGAAWDKNEFVKYSELLSTAEEFELRRLCAGFPGLDFFAPQSGAEKNADRLRPGQLQALEIAWNRLIFPMLNSIGDFQGIDLIPVGWLAGVPWHAVGSNPLAGNVLGRQHSISILPGFWWYDTEKIDIQCFDAVYVEGCNKDVEQACDAERDELKSLGFRVVRKREEIIEAMKSAAIVHFSGHGVFPKPNAPGEPHFRLFDGTTLTLEDFQGASLPAVPPLVTFSACELGFVLQSQGNLFGFPGYLLACGTRAVVGFASKINAHVAKEFFSRFYYAFKQGRCVGESAIQAFQARGNMQVGHRDLTRWSAFRIYGDQWMKFNVQPISVQIIDVATNPSPPRSPATIPSDPGSPA